MFTSYVNTQGTLRVYATAMKKRTLVATLNGVYVYYLFQTYSDVVKQQTEMGNIAEYDFEFTTLI